MAIDLQNEEILSINDAARSLPRIDGKRPHLSTIWRWARVGVRGVKLDYVRLGRRVCTSKEALARFAQALAEADDVPRQRSDISPRIRSRTGRQRQRDIARAEAELRAAGF